MSSLIDDLLGLSRINRAQIRPEPIDLSELARDVVAELRKREPDRDVEIYIEEGLRGRGDPRLLTVVLENLLGNAWKFTSRRAQARVTIGQEQRDGTSVFYVRDNGAGFDMSYAAKLFGPFQRAHRESEFEGTGIGLATVSRIISRHGGRIWVEAEVDKGATFFLVLGGNS